MEYGYNFNETTKLHDFLKDISQMLGAANVCGFGKSLHTGSKNC